VIQPREQELMTVDAELRLPAATAQLVRFHLDGPVDSLRREQDVYYIDLCLTPRMHNARACYRERWSAQRFERIGNLFVVPPGEPIHARSDGGNQASLVCQLRPALLQTWLERDLEWTDSRLKAGLDIPDGNIRRLLLRLVEELREPGFASAMLMELITGQLAIELVRYCAAIGESAESSGLAAWRLRRIDERLREVREPPTLTELAELCRLSVRQLTRAFRASRGCSIGEHVARSRIDHARRMLTAEPSVKAVAYTLGFSSPSSFCFAFRRATGETPHQFRLRASHRSSATG